MDECFKMRFQYTAEQLLRLRDSPLVCKPENLPPIEEWMGPPPEPTPRKPSMHRARTDDPSALVESPHRRPPMFSRGQSAVPDDIVLGPPKTSFASSTSMRNFGKSTDSPDRSSIAPFDDDTPRADRYNFREKFFKDRERPDRDSERTRELRPGFSNGRRTTRDDGDNWANLGRSRGSGQDDGDRFSRRNGEREREGPSHFRERGSKPYDSYGKDQDDADREHVPRRTGFGRGRNEPSWFRDDNAQGTREKEGVKESVRDREWRDKDRRDDREWIKGTRAERTEHNPEWMETSSPFEKKQTHTAEDLQKWKERMKANAVSSTSTPKEEVEQPPIPPERPTSGTVKGEAAFAKPDSPIIMDNSFDKFLGLWNEPVKRVETATASSESSPALAKKEPKGGKASRFTSFFAPQEDISRRVSEQASSAASPSVQKDNSSREDKEAFQRILQMLGGSSINSGSSTPHGGNPSAPPDDPTQPLSASAASPAKPPPGLQSLFSHSRQSSAVVQPKGPGSHPSRGSTPANKDSEFLLKLMQQSRSPPAVSEQPPGLRGPRQPGLELQGVQRSLDDVAAISKSPGGFPLPLFDQLQGPLPERHEGEHVADAAAAAAARKKVPPGPPPGFFDDHLAGFPRRPPIDSPQRGPNIPPPGLQRPPGLDGMPPQPSWQGNHLPPPPPPPQQGIAPPPGFGMSAMRGPGPNPFPSGILPPPPPHNLPIFGNERGPGHGHGPGSGPGPGPGPANGGPLPPPNMPPPPPGFFGLNGPLPPGFPPMPPYSPEGLMGHLSGPGPAGVPAGGARRPPFDMFADVGPAAGINGRGAPPGL